MALSSGVSASSSAGIGGSSELAADSGRSAIATGVPDHSRSDNASSPVRRAERHARDGPDAHAARRSARSRAGPASSDAARRKRARRDASRRSQVPSQRSHAHSLFGVFAPAVVVGDRAQRLQLLRLRKRQPPAGSLRSNVWPPTRKYAAGRPPTQSSTAVAGALRRAPRNLIPARIEVPEQRRALFDAAILPELQLRRIGARLQALQPAAHAGRELAGIAEAHRRRRLARHARHEHRTGRRRRGR